MTSICFGVADDHGRDCQRIDKSDTICLGHEYIVLIFSFSPVNIKKNDRSISIRISHIFLIDFSLIESFQRVYTVNMTNAISF